MQKAILELPISKLGGIEGLDGNEVITINFDNSEEGVKELFQEFNTLIGIKIKNSELSDDDKKKLIDKIKSRSFEEFKNLISGSFRNL
jgi:hypothetical protein